MRTQGFEKTKFCTLAVIGTLVLSLSAQAQGNGMRSTGSGTTLHGVPPSVTSFGFGGQRGFHGVPASVTSPNFGGSSFGVHQGIHQEPFIAPRRHRNRGFISPFYGNVVAVPYAYPVYVTDSGVDDSMEEEDYRGGPTIFDRRGPGTEEYGGAERRDRDEEDYRANAPAQSKPEVEAADQQQTVLVFKDGTRREVLNYAIVGSMLYDLSNGLTRKVALAELDLPATVKQNDDRGVEFQLPASLKTN